MSTYIIYDKENGNILHVHREYYMDSGKTVELNEDDMLKKLGELLPDDVELGVISTKEPPEPVRGYRYYVDLTSNKLMRVETPKAKKELML
jgi:hypothetical protein